MIFEKNEQTRKLRRARSKRAGKLGRIRCAMRALKHFPECSPPEKRAAMDPHAEDRARLGYDPEMLYVECGKCGAPVLWDEGRATKLLSQAGIDPLELDSSCILITDACPACGSKEEYAVQIFRIASNPVTIMPPLHGNA